MLIPLKSFIRHILIIIIAMGAYTQCFNTIDELKHYSAAHPEFPPADNDNWYDPDYSRFHASLTPNFFEQFIYRIGLLPERLWDPYHCMNLLEKVTTYQEIRQRTGNYLVRIGCSEKDVIYIFGDLHGALHSITRNLIFLNEQGVIDEHFTLQNQHTYLVFNGNLINRSAYTLETLTVVLMLLHKNPDRVFYIRGAHESDNFWLNFGLGREITVRTKETAQLASMLRRFFNTLPSIVYLNSTHNPHDLIRISFQGVEDTTYNKQEFGDFFEACSTRKVAYHQLTNNRTTRDNDVLPIDTKICITAENWREGQRNITGLTLLSQQLGATTWAVLSSPIQAHTEHFSFVYDAFVKLQPKNYITESTLTLYHQNIQTQDGFKQAGIYNAYTGAIQGSSYDIRILPDIKIGSTMSLVLGVPAIGKPIEAAMGAIINNTNQHSGINGHHIRLFVYNDNYSTFLAKKNAALLMENDIDMILLPVGSPTVTALIEYVKKHQLLLIAPVTGSPELRDSTMTHILHMRPSNTDEVQAIIYFLINEHNVQNFAFFYQDDAYGALSLEVAKKILQKKGITEWIEIPYQIGTTDFSEQVQKISGVQADAIGFFSASLPTQEFIRQVGVERLTMFQLFGISGLGEVSFIQFTQQVGLKFIYSSAVPNPSFDQRELVVNYRALMDSIGLPYDTFSLESYMATVVFTHIMQTMTAPFTKEKFIRSFEDMHDSVIEGFTFSFNKDTRSIAKNVWINVGHNKEWIEIPLDELEDL